MDPDGGAFQFHCSTGYFLHVETIDGEDGAVWDVEYYSPYVIPLFAGLENPNRFSMQTDDVEMLLGLLKAARVIAADDWVAELLYPGYFTGGTDGEVASYEDVWDDDEDEAA